MKTELTIRAPFNMQTKLTIILVNYQTFVDCIMTFRAFAKFEVLYNRKHNFIGQNQKNLQFRIMVHEQTNEEEDEIYRKSGDPFEF